MKDLGIILFGKKIDLPESAKITNLPAFSAAGEKSRGGLVTEDKTFLEEDRVNREVAIAEKGQQEVEAKPEDEPDDNPKTPSIDEESMPEKSPTTGTEGDTTNLQPKALKKPDKILPCPRCDSMDTKFCYYNNCNINQPRHFCKSCQRYWTAGGTMRNMPVGAGRRKKKTPASHCHFITISQEAFQSSTAPQIEFAADSDGVHNCKVLSFSSNSPHQNKDDFTGGSTVATSNAVTENVQHNNGFHSQVQWIPGASWPYNPWNSAIPFPIPAICPPGYPPMPIYPSPYWSSGYPLMPNFPILGKHSRDVEAIPKGSDEEPKKQKNLVLIPKTLRIDDPDEAAKSSIWATLGIKNENSSRGDLFKAFQAKGDEKMKHPAIKNSPVLQANPAALSRSLCFQERA